jgi:acetyl esterase/lipase
VVDGVLYVYLDGSVNYSDWVRNFAVGRRNTPQGYVNKVDHREALATIRELRPAIEVCRRVVVGGHSRGGSEAYSMAVELRASGRPTTCFLFAPKRTGCRDYQGGEYLAYRHRGDWVPFLPFWYAKWHLTTFGIWRPVWASHEPREYGQKITAAGF